MADWIEKVDFDKISPDFPCGFEGFLPIKALVESKRAEIPEKQGVYLILTRTTQMPDFNADNPGFAANGLTPRDVEALQRQWNTSSPIVYIGKAGGPEYDAQLRSRLGQYFAWFSGKGRNHKGGRDIWQIDNPGELLVAWRVTEDEDPRACEAGLIRKFKREHEDKRPFANHQG